MRTGCCFDKNKQNTKIGTLNGRVCLPEKTLQKKRLSVFETKVKKNENISYDDDNRDGPNNKLKFDQI